MSGSDFPESTITSIAGSTHGSAHLLDTYGHADFVTDAGRYQLSTAA